MKRAHRTTEERAPDAPGRVKAQSAPARGQSEVLRQALRAQYEAMKDSANCPPAEEWDSWHTIRNAAAHKKLYRAIAAGK